MNINLVTSKLQFLCWTEWTEG